MKTLLSLFLFVHIFAFGELPEPTEGIFIYYNPKEQTLLHKERFFPLLSSPQASFCSHYVSIGNPPFSREIISFEPENAKLLEKKYQELLDRILQTQRAPEEIFRLTASFVRHEIFSPPLCTEENINIFLQEWMLRHERVDDYFTLTDGNELFPVIPLDDFVKAKSGVCRHLSLVVGYLLDRLQNEALLNPPMPRGRTYLVRDEVILKDHPSNHAWNLFISDDGQAVWHIDAMWEILRNLHTEQASISRIYGHKALKTEQQILSNNE